MDTEKKYKFPKEETKDLSSHPSQVSFNPNFPIMSAQVLLI